MPTIKDIARLAGVSHGTVSNVLNKTGKVSTEKIHLVEEAARKLGYVPNTQAQRLRQGISLTIALILPTLKKDTYLALYTALLSGFSGTEYTISLHITEDIENREVQLLNTLPHADLAAVVTVSCLSHRYEELYSQLSCPVLFIDRNLCKNPGKDRAFISFDLFGAGQAIGENIAAQKIQRAAYFSSPSRFDDDLQIYLGLSQVLEQKKISLHRYSSDGNLCLSKAFSILSESPVPDAVISSSLFRAQALTSAMACTKKNIPCHITVCSVQAFPHPDHTVYQLDYPRLGAYAANILKQRLMEHKDMPPKTILECRGFPFSSSIIKMKEEQKLSLITLSSPSTTALQNLLPLLKEATGISLSITSLSYDDLYESLRLLNDRFHYDLVRMDVAWLDTLGTQIYMPLREAGIDPDTCFQELIGQTQRCYTHIRDTAYTLPFDPSALILLYRSDLFSDATLQRAYYEKYHEILEVPKTIKQYEHIARFFTRAFNPDSPTLYGTTCTCGHTMMAACSFLPFYLASGGPVIENGKLCLNTKEMVQGSQDYMSLVPYARSTDSGWWADSVQEFANGFTATAITYSNHVNYLMNSKHSSVVGQTNAAIIPGQHPLLGGGVLGINKFSDKTQACREFIQWYYSKDISALLQTLGGTSPLAEAYNDPQNMETFPWLAATRDSLEIGTRGINKNIVPDFSNRHFEFVLGTAIRQVIDGNMSPQQAAEFAQSIY